MRILISIFLFSVLQSFSQHEEPYKPLTPFADISFEEDMIIYTIDRKNIMMNPGLLPKVIDRRLLRLEFSHELQNVSGKYIAESQMAIRDYVNNEVVSIRSDKEQMDYLKLCALLVIWDNELSQHAQTELNKIAVSADKELKSDAGLVIELLKFYRAL